MPLFLYPDLGYAHSPTDPEVFADDPTYGDPIPAIDAKTLFESCEENGIDTDWWFESANTIKLNAGYEPSEAFLLLPGSTLDLLHAQNGDDTCVKDSPYHKIVFGNTNAGSLDTLNWSVVSAKAIDPSLTDNDNTVYLVKFVDIRYWLKKSECTHTCFNLVSNSVIEPAGDYDPTDPDLFPYDLETLDTDASEYIPWTWETLFEALIADCHPFVAINYNDDFPTSIPLDIRPEGRSAWRLYCDLLHSIGWEIYHDPVAGEFDVFPIGYYYPGDTTLQDNWASSVIDIAEVQSLGYTEDNIFPYKFRIGFQVRNRNPKYKQRNTYHFVDINTYDIFGTLSPAPGTHAYNAIDIGEVDVSDHSNARTCEIIITEAMTAVFRLDTEDADPENQTLLEEFATSLVTELIKFRLSTSVENTYGTVVTDITLSPAYGEALFVSNGYQLTSKFITTSIDPNSVPPTTDVGGKTFKLQLAVVTIGGTVSPDYSGDASSGTFEVSETEADAFRARLLIQTLDTLELDPDEPDEFGFEIFNKDITRLQENDIIRVWTPTGALVKGGMCLTDDDSRVLAEVFNATDYFRNLTGYDAAPADPIILYSDADAFYWDVAPSGGGAPGPPGATGATGPAGPPGPTYTGGCGIIVAGTVIHADIAELVGCGLEQQETNDGTTICKIKVKPSDLVGCGLAVASDNAAGTPDDCKIKVNPIALAGFALESETDTNTTTAVGPCKIRLIKTAYDSGKTQIYKHINGNFSWDDVVETVIKIPTSIELNLVSNTLEVKLNYQNYTVFTLATGTTGSMQDTVDTENC